MTSQARNLLSTRSSLVAVRHVLEEREAMQAWDERQAENIRQGRHPCEGNPLPETLRAWFDSVTLGGLGDDTRYKEYLRTVALPAQHEQWEALHLAAQLNARPTRFNSGPWTSSQLLNFVDPLANADRILREGMAPGSHGGQPSGPGAVSGSSSGAAPSTSSPRGEESQGRRRSSRTPGGQGGGRGMSLPGGGLWENEIKLSFVEPIVETTEGRGARDGAGNALARLAMRPSKETLDDVLSEDQALKRELKKSVDELIRLKQSTGDGGNPFLKFALDKLVDLDDLIKVSNEVLDSASPAEALNNPTMEAVHAAAKLAKSERQKDQKSKRNRAGGQGGKGGAGSKPRKGPRGLM